MRNLAFRGPRLPRLGAMRSGVSILALFTAGVVGVWYDPSDLPTLFQDSAGTTPVTAAGQPVGLMLDKSQGLVLGPELVTNGDFSAGTANWDIWTGGSQAVSGGQYQVTSIVSPGYGYQSFATVIGKTYEVVGTIVSVTGATFFAIRKSDNAPASSNLITIGSTVGLHRGVFVATASTTFIVCQMNSGTAVFDNISVRLLPGNHAVQATAAKRPIYGFHPFGGRRNLLTHTEALNTGPWVNSPGTTVTPNTDTAPDGTVTADTVNSTGNQVFQNVTAPNTGNFVVSVHIKKTTSATIYPMVSLIDATVFAQVILNTNTGVANVRTGTPGAANLAVGSVGDYWRLSFSGNFVATALVLALYAAGSINGTSYSDNTGSAVFWGVQIEAGTVATAYQKVVTQDEVTEAGVPSVHRLRFDSTDDAMATAAIDFTGTDKVSVFAGVRRIDATARMVAELSSTIANDGSFHLVCGTNGGFTAFSSAAKGSAGGTPAGINGTPPSTDVVSSTHDIAGNLSTIRMNGVAGTSNTSDKGTGNFGNYALNIGARNQTSLFFNGLFYGLIIPGKLVSAAEIASTEAYMAAKTGVVL